MTWMTWMTLDDLQITTALQPNIMPKAKNNSASVGIKAASPNNASVNLAVAE
jgi:hypothetical protein